MKITSINFKNLIVLACLLLTFLTTNAQTQKGFDIQGEVEMDNSGRSVCMPDANTIAIGSPQNNGNGLYSGHVRVYSWIGSVWVQKGSDILGEGTEDWSGAAVSMPDANTIAIGADGNDGNGFNSGHVRVYRWIDSVWEQKGADIDGETELDASGYSVSMPDANTIAIGAHYNSKDAGHVRIFNWNGNSWELRGSELVGEAIHDWSGYSVSMPDFNTIAIGAPNNDGNGEDAGHVRVYSCSGIYGSWSIPTWVQKGGDIDGEAEMDNSGYSVSMPDSNTIAIGAPYNDGNGEDAGHVRIFSWSGTAWVQKGADIDGETAGDFTGSSVSMPDSNIIAIGARRNDGNGEDAGHVRIYSWSGTAWVQKGADIDGAAARDYFGISVSMPDANTIAIGADGNDGNGIDAGHVRVYKVGHGEL